MNQKLQEINIIIKIAWRNVWRNKLRSTIVISAIALGLWGGLFVMSLVLGLNEQRMNGAVNSYLSHIQIHNPKYLENPKLKYSLQEVDEAIKFLEKDSRIKAFSKRVSSTGMAASSGGNQGVNILGIDPNEEKKVTNISNKIVEGEYFTQGKKNSIVIGQRLAKKLKLKLKSKLLITFQDIDKNIISIQFKVRGIYKTGSSVFDDSNIFVHKKALTQHLGIGTATHEIVALCNSIDYAESISKELHKILKKDLCQTWVEISPELGYAQEMMSNVVYIFMLIILLALSFSIINTMLMAVLERKKEIGMLMSIGMNKKNLFSMIAFETLFIVVIATPIGMLSAYLTITYFSNNGINLSVVEEGLGSLGIGAFVFPFLPKNLYINITLLTLIVAFLSSLFPARRALKLNPSEAVRSL
ncbi:MAG: ABC transporter permease [Saprospiraceae bacterium]|nr:ABC transporter permease [Saprospiraceae bacterium]